MNKVAAERSALAIAGHNVWLKDGTTGRIIGRHGAIVEVAVANSLEIRPTRLDEIAASVNPCCDPSE